jgi:pilus assembly protein CpaF
MRRLVFTALGMRPDRMVGGEVRGAEAFDLRRGLTSGHRGCLATCHAAGVEHGLRRLATLAGLAGSGLSSAQLGDLVLDGLDAVVVTGRSGRYRGVRQVVDIDADGQLHPRWPRVERDATSDHRSNTASVAA